MNPPNQDPQTEILADLLLQPKNRGALKTQIQPRQRYVDVPNIPAYPTNPIGAPFAH